MTEYVNMEPDQNLKYEKAFKWLNQGDDLRYSLIDQSNIYVIVPFTETNPFHQKQQTNDSCTAFAQLFGKSFQSSHIFKL